MSILWTLKHINLLQSSATSFNQLMHVAFYYFLPTSSLFWELFNVSFIKKEYEFWFEKSFDVICFHKCVYLLFI